MRDYIKASSLNEMPFEIKIMIVEFVSFAENEKTQIPSFILIF